MQVLTIITVLGTIQALLLLFCIIFRQRHWKNLPLILLIIAFALRLGTIPSWNAVTLLSHPWIYPMTAPLPFLFGPLLWWYLRSLGRIQDAVPPFVFLHFLPYIVEMLAIVIMLILMTPGEYADFIDQVFTGQPPLWLTIRNGAKVVLNIIYMVFGAGIAFGPLSRKVSHARRLWLRSLIVAPSLVLLVFSFVALAPSTPHFVLLALSVLMTSFIYVISFLLLVAPEAPGSAKTYAAVAEKPLYSDSDCQQLLAQIETLFIHGAAQDPDLCESDLAAELKVPANRISFAINSHYGMNFPSLLNKKRLQYFIEKVEQGALKKQSILSLAFEAGFPSKSTFNRVFKECYRVTPSEYAKKSG